jgi:hypothetical protein
MKMTIAKAWNTIPPGTDLLVAISEVANKCEMERSVVESVFDYAGLHLPRMDKQLDIDEDTARRVFNALYDLEQAVLTAQPFPEVANRWAEVDNCNQMLPAGFLLSHTTCGGFVWEDLSGRNHHTIRRTPSGEVFL